MHNSRIAEVQKLEPRKMMAATPLGFDVASFGGGQQLVIYGTRRDDAIKLSFNGSSYRLHTGTGYRKTIGGEYNSIRIITGRGNDSINIDKSVTVPAYVHGGAGNDAISGGSGDDFLYGEAGNDKVYGQAGRDTLVTLGGGTNDIAVGGSGEDFFWIDPARKERIDASESEIASGSVNRVSGFESSSFSVAATDAQSVSKELHGQQLADPSPTSSRYVYKSFDNKPLFASGGPSADDVKQGQIGDCYFLATLAGAADVSPDAIRSMISDLGDGTYAVRFNDSAGNAQFYRVDNDLAVYHAGSNTPAYAKLGADDSMWVAIAEKAYTFHRKQQGSYASINGGWMSEVFTAIGAQAQKSIWREQSGGAEAFMNWVEQRLADGEIVTLGVLNYAGELNMVSGHAYSVDRVETLEDGSKQLVVRNPWGVDGYDSTDGANDGYLKLAAHQAYSAINVFVTARAA